MSKIPCTPHADPENAYKCMFHPRWPWRGYLCPAHKAEAESSRGNVVTCVYCGHEYPDGTPTHKATLLTDHIKVCEKHPIRKAEADIAELQARLIRRTEESTATAYRDAETIRQMADALQTYLVAGHREARDHAAVKAKAALARWKGGA